MLRTVVFAVADPQRNFPNYQSYILRRWERFFRVVPRIDSSHSHYWCTHSGSWWRGRNSVVIQQTSLHNYLPGHAYWERRNFAAAESGFHHGMNLLLDSGLNSI